MTWRLLIAILEPVQSDEAVGSMLGNADVLSWHYVTPTKCSVISLTLEGPFGAPLYLIAVLLPELVNEFIEVVYTLFNMQ